ncbi:hypothetical protein CI109_104887 [Kwoniella shandongensis]|uniref:Uncharacterized protein n=1 Tax=Kwoniella shandongensis TaxID=1734106 RepID=A0A5M6BU06_9TREE|nr:uncharacterized protein CI109_006606 [Kwoniella shandongensis]KAA5525055.1 hypothetical protein CI109_006606 [Kwoniella shandongensis]
MSPIKPKPSPSPSTRRSTPLTTSTPLSKYKTNPPPGLKLGTIIHDSAPGSSDYTSIHSPDPLALSSSEMEAGPSSSSPTSMFMSSTDIGTDTQYAGPSSKPMMTLERNAAPGDAGSGKLNADTKGKGKAVERRVLPARIRRTAGGGAEGMREVEEMVVDWLERWGEPSSTPPDSLPIHLTSIPLNLVTPPPTQTQLLNQPTTPSITLTPSRHKGERIDTDGENKLTKEERIETPSWVMVKPGEDDEEEAKEELEVFGLGKGKGVTSPVKRLRRAAIGEEVLEDTSDAYYHLLHRKYEVFERRQRIREKEKLQFERYKMRSRIDLLRNMSKFSWATIVGTILSRSPDEWAKGREKIKEVGVDWLRDRLVREGEEVMKRYEELLPAEQKKPKQSQNTPSGAESRLSTPSRASQSMSLTPPPIILPARVAALRDTSTASAKRKRRSTGGIAGDAAEEDSPSRKTRTVEMSRASPKALGKEVKTYGKRKRSESRVVEEEEQEEDESQEEQDSEETQNRRGRSRPPAGAQAPPASSPQDSSSRLRLSAQQQSTLIQTTLNFAPTPVTAISQSRPLPPPPPTITSTAVPCLIEAAARRETSQDETAISKQRAESPRNGRLIAREKTRASRRLEVVHPFGLPVPSVVEYKSEFTLSDEEDFWPIIAGREENANRERRASLMRLAETTAITSVPNGIPHSGTAVTSAPTVTLAMTPEEVAEMEGVEEAVVL